MDYRYYLAEALDYLSLMGEDMDTLNHMEDELYILQLEARTFLTDDTPERRQVEASVSPPREDFFPYEA